MTAPDRPRLSPVARSRGARDQVQGRSEESARATRLAVSITAAALIGLLAPAPLRADTTPSELLAKGDAAYLSERYKQAIRAYEQAVAANDTAFAATMGIARSHLALGHFAVARDHAQRAVEKASQPEEVATALNLRGITYAREARALGEGRDHKKRRGERHALLQNAIALYREALGVSEPPSPAIWANLADAQSLAQEWPAARRSVEEYLRLAPDDGEAVAPIVAHLDCLEKSSAALDADDLSETEGYAPPTKVYFPSPQPVGREGRYGAAGFDGVIDLEGRFLCPRVIFSNGLDDEFLAGAVRTLSQWRFEPATLHGEPVIVTYTLTVSVSKQ